MNVPLPTAFVRTIQTTFGDAGRIWLQQLPALLDTYAGRWHLRLLPPFDLSFNYVAPAVRANGSTAVLKLGVLSNEILTEIAALRLYNGVGCVRLLEADEAGGAMLLEHLQPGTMLATLPDDDQATLIAAQTMQRLWRPVPADHPFPHIADWARGMVELRQHFDGGTGPFPARLVETAERWFADLLGSQAAPVVLHGDLHHYNILAAQREPWLVIDPKGIVGEPAYEVGALLRNPMPHVWDWPNPRRLLARRLDILHEVLGFDRQRMLMWHVAQAVLSAWWDYEDDDATQGWRPTIAWAEYGVEAVSRMMLM